MRLEGKVAWITGAGRGIGAATAQRFAREGASVVLSDVDEQELHEVEGAIQEAGGKALVVVGSVAERDDVQRIVETGREAFERLDVLINNAGINRDALVVKIKEGQTTYMAEEKWDSVLAVNLKGTFLCAQAAAAVMIPQGGGRIVNTASVSALGNIGQANYSASKAGVIGLTRTLALEWARFGINVNCVAPGATRTRMTEGIPEKILERLIQGIPAGRMADPGEIAAAHLYLASDEAAFVTGQVLFVDGGQTVGA
jgi:NAD(P)-dependent dehydrogenase (short-subunit alcohol dehydrogenase family)